MTGPEYWPWYGGGVAIAAVALSHWLLLQRTLAVSGRITAVIDRVRRGPADDGLDLSDEEAIEAVRAATAAAFGDEAVTDSRPQPTGSRAVRLAPLSAGTHILFLLALVAGGLGASLTSSTFAVTSSLSSETFAHVFGWLPAPVVLVFGGILVGFGTRMAGGCTSGHGLCGLSRFQPGSALATFAFFGTGIAASMLMEVLS